MEGSGGQSRSDKPLKNNTTMTTKTKSDLRNEAEAICGCTHTPGPWKVMPCPQHHGKHPFHDSRWISTEDAEVEYGDDPRPDQWCLGKGSLICEMRDGPPANARLIAAAPELIAALADCLAFWDAPPTGLDCPTSRRKKLEAIQSNARAAIAKARG